MPKASPYGLYYLPLSTSEAWELAFELEISTQQELDRALEIGSKVKAELKCYAVRLLKGHTDPTLNREVVRQIGRPTPLSLEQEVEMQARYMSMALAGNLDWAKQFAGALHKWRRMPLVERLKHLPPKKEEAPNEG